MTGDLAQVLVAGMLEDRTNETTPGSCLLQVCLAEGWYVKFLDCKILCNGYSFQRKKKLDSGRLDGRIFL